MADSTGELQSVDVSSSSDTEREPNHPKKAKRACYFQAAWRSRGLSASKRGAEFAQCDVCGTDFSVAHGGVGGIKKHLATSKHREALASRTLTGYFQPASASD